MLGSFPDPMPDELLFSVLCRYHKISGNRKYHHTNTELYDSLNLSPSIYFGRNLTYMCSNIPNPKYTTEYLIRNHTLMPLIEIFLDSDTAERLNESILGRDEGSEPPEKIAYLRKPNFIKYCPICIESDEGQYGIPYFHRIHNIPGIGVCMLHETSLMAVPFDNSTYPLLANLISQDYGKHAFINTRDNMNYMKDIKYLLFSGLRGPSIKKLRDNYLCELTEKGYLSKTGRLFEYYTFPRKFLQSYSRTFLSLLDMETSSKDFESVVKYLKRTTHEGVSFVCHMLLIRFLFGNMENCIKHIGREYHVFGPGPWPCLNTLAEHYNQPVIESVSLAVKPNLRVIGTFTCNCGFKYQRIVRYDAAKSDDVETISVLSYGPLLENKIRSLQDKGYDFYMIINETGLEGSVIRRFIKRPLY